MDDLRLYIISTVFQSYQDGRWVIMKGCVRWNSVYILKRSSPQAGIEPGTARSAGQRLTYWATGYTTKIINSCPLDTTVQTCLQLS